jgi:hypothetical protein
MVFYFTSSVPGYTLFMGKDKHENEGLIAHGFDEDVWFHVDNFSSAHVYVRLSSSNASWDALPEALLTECGQLVKANSIEGTKKASVIVIYTPWSNLKKDGSMDTGQVGFHNPQLVKRFVVGERDKELLRTLGQSKRESFPDLAEERRQRDREIQSAQKQEAREKLKREKEQALQFKKDKEERSYDRLFAGASSDDKEGAAKVTASSDVSVARQVEEDFM